MESRVLGPIELDGGAGGGAMNGTVDFAGKPLAVRIEIDFPDKLSDAVINDVDMVLENLDFTHNLARDTIAAGLRRDGTAAAQMFQVWEERGGDRQGKSDEFLESLQPTQITILPDGGKWSPDRVVMTYELTDGSVGGEIKVRFLEPTGPELAPAPRAGYN